MLILIAESKTMSDRELPVTPELYATHTPDGEVVADEVMATVAALSVSDIADAIKISHKMAAKVAVMAYEFPNKGLGLRAIDAYTGVVFKNLSFPTLPDAARIRTMERVRIISSLYGWLRPDDYVKPYRFDYTTPLAPEDRSFCSYWRRDVTVSLVRDLRQTGETDVLDLLPADASKCVDWKLVKNFAKVWKVDFKDILDGNNVRTPHAGRLKALRGRLLRNILTQDLKTPEDLRTFVSEDLIPLGTPDYPDHIAFASMP